MNLERGQMLTLAGGKTYVITAYLTIDKKVYYSLVNKDDMKDLIICNIIADNDDVKVITIEDKAERRAVAAALFEENARLANDYFEKQQQKEEDN